MKAPRFFCDNCGAEVGRDLRACPRCGRFFASVRCPACGFSGEEKLFRSGCPSCGYSAHQQDARRGGKKPPLLAAGALPVWVYVISVAALLAVCAALAVVIGS